MPDEAHQRNFRSPRSLNRRMRYVANLTLPQLGALACAGALGVLCWWILGWLPFLTGGSLVLTALRLLGSGVLAGALGVLFYALADDMREPVLRQAVTYVARSLLRRHTYRKEVPHAVPPRRSRR